MVLAGSMISVAYPVLDRMFARPRGVLGRLGGRMMARLNVDIERRVADLAQLSPGQSVLVVGPGPGVGLVLAAERTGPEGQVVGIEPSATMRAQAAARCAGLVQAGRLEAGRIEVRDAHVAATGATDGSIDVVISVNNVMFWPDRDAAFAELHRVLRPGGRLVIGTHERGLRFTGIGIDQLRAEMERAGFTGITVTTKDHGGTAGVGVELLASRATLPA